MKIKNLITIALAAIMSVSAMSIPTFAENNTTIDEQLFIDTAKDAIYDYIVERGEEYYNPIIKFRLKQPLLLDRS